jgi:hypothetical protein
MPLAAQLEESTEIAGISPSAGRPLFVPPGIRSVRTGRTTRAELDRLLGDADTTPEYSGVRLAATPTASAGLFRFFAAALGLSPQRVR